VAMRLRMPQEDVKSSRMRGGTVLQFDQVDPGDLCPRAVVADDLPRTSGQRHRSLQRAGCRFPQLREEEAAARRDRGDVRARANLELRDSAAGVDGARDGPGVERLAVFVHELRIEGDVDRRTLCTSWRDGDAG